MNESFVPLLLRVTADEITVLVLVLDAHNLQVALGELGNTVHQLFQLVKAHVFGGAEATNLLWCLFRRHSSDLVCQGLVTTGTVDGLATDGDKELDGKVLVAAATGIGSCCCGGCRISCWWHCGRGGGVNLEVDWGQG